MNSLIIFNILLVVLCVLVVLDCYYCSSVAMQLVCFILMVALCWCGYHIAQIRANKSYITPKERQDFEALKNENIALTNELATARKRTTIGSEQLERLHQIVLTNKRLTLQIENLQTHLQTLYEQLHGAKVVQITTVQEQTKPPLKTTKAG